jgi:hypothetical protein
MTHNWQPDPCGQTVCGYCGTIVPPFGPRDEGLCPRAPKHVLNAYQFGQQVQRALEAMRDDEVNAYAEGRKSVQTVTK